MKRNLLPVRVGDEPFWWGWPGMAQHQQALPVRGVRLLRVLVVSIRGTSVVAWDGVRALSLPLSALGSPFSLAAQQWRVGRGEWHHDNSQSEVVDLFLPPFPLNRLPFWFHFYFSHRESTTLSFPLLEQLATKPSCHSYVIVVLPAGGFPSGQKVFAWRDQVHKSSSSCLNTCGEGRKGTRDCAPGCHPQLCTQPAEQREVGEALCCPAGLAKLGATRQGICGRSSVKLCCSVNSVAQGSPGIEDHPTPDCRRSFLPTVNHSFRPCRTHSPFGRLRGCLFMYIHICIYIFAAVAVKLMLFGEVLLVSFPWLPFLSFFSSLLSVHP